MARGPSISLPPIPSVFTASPWRSDNGGPGIKGMSSATILSFNVRTDLRVHDYLFSPLHSATRSPERDHGRRHREADLFNRFAWPSGHRVHDFRFRSGRLGRVGSQPSHRRGACGLAGTPIHAGQCGSGRSWLSEKTCSGTGPHRIEGRSPLELNRLQTAPDFSVLIVNYNGGAYVQGALDSLKRQTHRSFEVILLDNASTDGSVDTLDTAGLPRFTLVRGTDNHGFARGNNLAAAQAAGRWLALLNPDAAARPDWLAEVLAGTRRHPDVTSFACTQLWMHDETRLDGAGDNYLIFGIPWRGGYHRPVSDLPAEGTCFSPCGASAVYLRETFVAAGGFDERFFCFCEDVDLGFRLRLEGGECVFLPRAVVSHAGGGLSEKVSGFAVRYGTRNRLWVYLKCMPMPLLVLTLPGHLLLTAAILLRGLITGRFGDAMVGLMEALRGLGPVWADRKVVQAHRRASVGALLRAMAWKPWSMIRRQVHIKQAV